MMGSMFFLFTQYTIILKSLYSSFDYYFNILYTCMFLGLLIMYLLLLQFEDVTYDWLYWPQARKPYADEVIDYIKSLDAEEDIALLKFHGWEMPPKCARTLRISTMLLKKGVERGLTPFDIGSIMSRKTLNKESVIEEIIEEANDSVLPDSSEDAFLETVSEIMDRRLDEIAGSPS